uniref:Uncharacterized protein n=1 Tax=Amphilophus citrinellus TaxID=61819 RepID=A0A3Q0SYP9_AMPCI
MEAKKLKRDVEALIASYIGQKLREDAFDPKGKGTSTMLDDLAHYDLAISVALWWLEKKEGRGVLDREMILGSAQYPNRLEREAMILSSFAGIIMVSKHPSIQLKMIPTPFCFSQPKGSIVYPFTLSYHPFAMLGSYKAVHHSKEHSKCVLSGLQPFVMACGHFILFFWRHTPLQKSFNEYS